MKTPLLSIFIPTFNRAELLKVCLNSVFQQTFKNYEIILVNDCSTDETEKFINSIKDPRVRKFNNKINLGSKFGDKIMFERFLYYQARGEYIAALCDDDYYYDKEILMKMLNIMENNKSVSLSLAGVGQKYLKPFKKLFKPNAPYIKYKFVDKTKKIIFAKDIYPQGLINSHDFLKLFAHDVGNRNIGGGAAIYRRKNLIKADLKKTKFIKRQMGWWYYISSALQGNIYYFNEPGYISLIHENTLSFAVTQEEHYLDCLFSIEIAFKTKSKMINSIEIENFRNEILLAITVVYLSNKYGAKLGYFKRNPIGDINHLFRDEISINKFFLITKKFKINLQLRYKIAILFSGLPVFLIKVMHVIFIRFNGVFWWKNRVIY